MALRKSVTLSPFLSGDLGEADAEVESMPMQATILSCCKATVRKSGGHAAKAQADGGAHCDPNRVATYFLASSSLSRTEPGPVRT